MKKLLGLALLMVMGIIITSCRDDADRRRAYVENNTQDTLVLYTKGSVLLVCLRCVDIHWSCVETCRRHIPTLRCDLRPRLLWQAWIIAYYQGSHRFNEIQQEDYSWKFVLICGWFFRTQIARIIRICGFVESCWICVRVLFVEGGE